VLDAARALEAANASGDAQKIRAAMEALDAALRGQAQAQAVVHAGLAEAAQADAAPASEAGAPEVPADQTQPAIDAEKPQEAPAVPVAARKPVVAVRGDDRPGQKKAEAVAPARSGKFGDRKDSRGPRDMRADGRTDVRGPRGEGRDGGRGAGWTDDRPSAPRLGDTAFRAQRDAIEHAQLALKKLAVQAHGESLTQLLAAWEKRDAALLPSVQELGGRVAPATRVAWSQALGTAPSGDAATALLRLEMAAEVPTPASDLDARRALQLQLLTRRNDPAPSQTWGQDTAGVLASAFEPGQARRLQNVLKVLLRR
jgi:hypothetical protein